MIDGDYKMPFGKYKDERIEDVPADYLLWLWDNGMFSKTQDPVHQYIAENFSTLETCAPDVCVQHRPTAEVDDRPICKKCGHRINRFSDGSYPCFRCPTPSFV